MRLVVLLCKCVSVITLGVLQTAAEDPRCVGKLIH